VDPITVAIWTAISAGVLKGVGNAGEQVISDAYKALRDKLARKFGADSDVGKAVAAVEAKPSEGRKQTLSEEIAAARADKDPELHQAAQYLLDLLSRSSGGSTFREFNMAADRGGVNVVGSQISGNPIMGGVHNTYVRVVQTLSDLEDIDPSIRATLVSQYRQAINNSPNNAQYYFALGLHYLDLGDYRSAIDSLTKAREKSPLDAGIAYYLAVATIGGRRPKTMRHSEIKMVEEYLDAAIKLDSEQFHYFYLLALVKYDYYWLNGLRASAPDVNELLAYASHCRPVRSELDQLLRHVSVPANIRQAIGSPL
jgi:tetratricopeptide (TPR) repeat protein